MIQSKPAAAPAAAAPVVTAPVPATEPVVEKEPAVLGAPQPKPVF